MELNLTANGKPQELILTYLQANVSETLAEKINNGVLIEKDGKRLLNKKTLDGFMKYANGEAKKLAEKGANSACVEDAVVYGWAIHYFEEDSIEGTLYNEDGTEYKVPAPVKTTTATTYTPPKPAPKPQISMFDLISSDNNADEEPDELTDEELEKEPTLVVEQPKPVQKKGSAMYQHYLSIKEKYKDCIVFYRLGDFYEMFGEDAKIASDVLNLTLTGRDVGLDERVPMTGIPYHAVDNYISKLVSKNYKIAVFEQLSGDVDRVIAKQPDSQIVDIKSGEILQDEIPTVSKVTAEVDSEEPSDELDLSHIDKETLLILYDLLDGNLDIQ